jgi:Putative 2OG-Fe(II) oxygenase
MERTFQHIALEDNDTIPVLAGNLEPELLAMIKEAVLKIKDDNPIAHNQHLAGAIKEEYTVKPAKIPELLYYLDEMYATYSHHFKNIPSIMKDIAFESGAKVEIGDFWVNFQKKHEFNPIHHHDGLVSFVLWIQIPFDIEKEKAMYNGGTINVTSQFQFVYPGLTNDIALKSFPVEKEWEGTILMFPSSLNHCVYPFYTSDDYRISLSGNLSLASAPNIGV